MSLISNCGHDENNAYHGGTAGDQTGGEWALIPWYSRPWNCVLRHPDETVRQYHADMAEAAARNDCIGYDQYQRDTFGVQLKAAGDDPAKITVKCETDCSKGIIDITKAIGRKTGRKELQNITATYTGNMRAAYKAAGYQVLTESKYLTGPDYLLPGDILLYDAAHVATNIQKGTKASVGKTSGTAASSSGTLNKTPKWVGKVTADNVDVRNWPGSSKSISSWPKLGKDNLIDVCDTLKDNSGNDWYYVRISGKYYGFVPVKYVKQAV